MTQSELKELTNLGAELGAAKAEVERLREALRPFAAFEAVRSKQGGCTPKSGTVWAVASGGGETEITVEHLQAAVAALSQQAEPTDTYTAVDMATAAAQGFRDGQAAVEQAPAQDEREAFKRALHSQKVFKLSSATIDAAEWAWFARPAQTAQQPEQSGLVGQVCGGDGTHNTVNVAVVGPVPWGDLRIGTPVRLIPAPAQGAGDASA